MRGWALLAAYVAGYDLFARVTLSRQFREAADQYPVTVGLTTAYILFHLYGVLPAKIDPLQHLGRVRRKKS